MTYAIALGAVERGVHYLGQFPGYGGILLALACLGVPFVAGAKLLDSVKPTPVPARVRSTLPPRRSDARIPRGRPLNGLGQRRPNPVQLRRRP